MAILEGTIVQLSYHSGKIRGDDDKEYGFNKKAMSAANFADAEVGQRVRFRPDGDRGRDVELLAEVVQVKPGGVGTRPPRGHAGPYRFLNPYNFIRPLTVSNAGADPLLGRTVPPPHDRYVGLTGRITCELTVTTPLFISDSEEIKKDDSNKEHLHYRFFRDPLGNIAIPGSSLRGAIRSIFEAATNSCFQHFGAYKRLSYHLPPRQALQLVPGRVHRKGQSWELELLPGTSHIIPDRAPSGHQYAAWVPVYRPLRKSRTKAKAPSSPYSRRPSLSLVNWEHGNPCYALLESHKHPLRHFQFWSVRALAQSREALPAPQSNQRTVQGYLCITNQNIENKHDERFFFHDPGSDSQNLYLTIEPEVRRAYNELIEDYQERHASAMDKRRRDNKALHEPAGDDPAFSRFIIKKNAKHLSDDDLVYAMLDRRGMGFSIRFLVPVSVPRVGYETRIGKLLYPEDLRACDRYERLCPACRTFGWVWHSDDPGVKARDLSERTAYASRIRISHATRQAPQDDATGFSATLNILSTPKPTTTRFYLKSRSGRDLKGLPDDKVGYDAHDMMLRGRKVYRHQGDQVKRQEYESPADPKTGAPTKSDQNRTVHDVQPAGTKFDFSIDFENLAPVELGALLWSLELEGWHHRLGYAKPLGFGSATFHVSELRCFQPALGYEQLGADAEWIDAITRKDEWVKLFKVAMSDRYGGDFRELPNIKDLRALLAESPDLPVHYPRSTIVPLPEGRNYEWFMGNKRGGRNAGPRLVLDVAAEDIEGLPLLDRSGSRVDK